MNSPFGLVSTNVQKTEDVSSPLSNDVTMLISAFSSLLEIEDPRFNISIYGPFIEDIPKRLGTNEALDAAALAFVAAFPWLHTRQLSLETYHKFTHALKALRVCLNDPVRAGTPETLCAVYMTMICQVSRFSYSLFVREEADDRLISSHLIGLASKSRRLFCQSWRSYCTSREQGSAEPLAW
jgi:hypothetical protein